MFRPPFLYAIFLTVLMLGCGKPSQYKNISLVTESKDKKYRVWLYEHSERFDRNFDVWVERTADGFKTNIFQSPDEGLIIHEQYAIRGDRIIRCHATATPRESIGKSGATPQDSA